MPTPQYSSARPRARTPRAFARCAALILVLSTLTAASPVCATTPSEKSDATPEGRPGGAQRDWAWPIAPPIALVRPFIAPATAYAAGHRGLDVAALPGDAVRAAAAGVVTFAGPVAGRSTMTIDHGDGVRSSIEPVAASVAVGDHVSAGEAIGTVSEGGHCSNRCAHFGVRIDDEYVSPLLFLGGMPRSVLLPIG